MPVQLPIQLIDTHVHINFDVFQSDLEALQARWLEAGVVRLVHSCVEPGELVSIQALADRFPELSFAVGLHPLDADKWLPEMGHQILSVARSDARVVAIGETGLDFFKAENQQEQKAVFEAQLAIARALGLPVIIHCRDAAAPMAEFLRQVWQAGSINGVMHCWSGTPEETRWFLDLGFYISFSGIVTFKNATQVQAAVKIVPDDRLLVETDCPFLAPVPKRGEKRNEPAYVRYVAERVAELRSVAVEAIAEQTTANARRLFRLPVPGSSSVGSTVD